jgi:hypothetical protein
MKYCSAMVLKFDDLLKRIEEQCAVASPFFYTYGPRQRYSSGTSSRTTFHATTLLLKKELLRRHLRLHHAGILASYLRRRIGNKKKFFCSMLFIHKAI